MFVEQARPVGSTAAGEQDDYVDLILGVMRDKGVSLRALALRAGIGKSRVGNVLHNDPLKRSPMSLTELQALLRALDLDLLKAAICVETLRDKAVFTCPRYASLVPMLCAMFHDLPANLITALDDLQDMDGSEVRAEWAGPLQRAVIKRVIHEISAVANRRAALSDFSLFA